MSEPSPQGGRRDEFTWKDTDGCHGRVIGYDEVRLEQGDVPSDVAALIEVGEPPQDGTIWANPVYLTADDAVNAALVLLDAAAQTRARTIFHSGPAGPVPDDDHERRWHLHVHAASISDMTFWVERLPNDRFRACEVETGVCSAPATTAREALENYWEGRYAGNDNA